MDVEVAGGDPWLAWSWQQGWFRWFLRERKLIIYQDNYSYTGGFYIVTNVLTYPLTRGGKIIMRTLHADTFLVQ